MPRATAIAPHTSPRQSVGLIMRQVLYALLPGTLATTWFFGLGVMLNILIAVVVAVVAEAAMLWLRGKPLAPFLGDYSALVAGWLLALALPPLVPWWLPASGAAFAMVVVKHLYGGLGYNPFNPAMAGYVVVLISFPKEMTQWLAPEMLAVHRPELGQTLMTSLTGHLPAGFSWDAITRATPLDTVRTRLGQGLTMDEIRPTPLWGALDGWGWIAGGYLVGGLWLLYQRVIDWPIPAAVLAGLSVMAALCYVLDSGMYPSPVFQLFSGGAMLGAFFIATDPVTASTTPRGRLIYGAGIGGLTYVIRAWGGYPDGIAFAVLLMNMAVPVIDACTRPRVFGQRSDRH